MPGQIQMHPVCRDSRFISMHCLSRQVRRLGFGLWIGVVGALTVPGCDRAAAPFMSRLNKANVDQIHQGMTKNQVQAILGSPTNSETKDFVVYKRTKYLYVEGKLYLNLAFKNDELDSKETNIGTQ